MTSLQMFRLLCRDLGDVEDWEVVDVLSLAAARLNAETLGSLYAQACCYMAGHMLQSGPRGGAAGQIVRQKVGQVEVEYDSSQETWGTTWYGQELARLIKEAGGSQAFIVPEYLE